MDINIGERITYLRTERGFSVNHLADRSGVSQSYLREIEMGHYTNPSVDILDAICDALGLSLREFFDPATGSEDAMDLLWEEIAQLSPGQRENLRMFLESIRV